MSILNIFFTLTKPDFVFTLNSDIFFQSYVNFESIFKARKLYFLFLSVTHLYIIIIILNVNLISVFPYISQFILSLMVRSILLLFLEDFMTALDESVVLLQ